MDTTRGKLHDLGFGFSGVPCGERVCFRHSLQLETGSRKRFVPHSVVGTPTVLRVLARTYMGRAQLSGHILESGAGHCSLDSGGLSHLHGEAMVS